jgi:polyisoprenoid-binding protein YceI
MFRRLFPVLLFPLILLGAGCASEPVIEVTTDAVEEEVAAFSDGVYELFVPKSEVTWEASKKLVDSGHNGTVNVSSGRVVVESGQITSGTVTVDMITIAALDLVGEKKAQLEGHLHSEDFFDVANHPAATFTIISVEDGAITGTMTIKGIDEEISFDAEIEQEGLGIGMDADMELDRSIWDIRYGSESFFDDLGDAVINDIFTLGLDLEFQKEGIDEISQEAFDEISDIITENEAEMVEEAGEVMAVPEELSGDEAGEMVVEDDEEVGEMVVEEEVQ